MYYCWILLGRCYSLCSCLKKLVSIDEWTTSLAVNILYAYVKLVSVRQNEVCHVS